MTDLAVEIWRSSQRLAQDPVTYNSRLFPGMKAIRRITGRRTTNHLPQLPDLQSQEWLRSPCKRTNQSPSPPSVPRNPPPSSPEKGTSNTTPHSSETNANNLRWLPPEEISKNQSRNPPPSTHLCRGINDRNELLQVPRQQRIIQRPILVLQALQECVLAYRRVAGSELFVSSLALLVKGIRAIREPADQSKRCALAGREPGPFVEARRG